MINQYNIKDIFDYKDGELIWKIYRIGNKGIGSIAGTCSDRYKKAIYKQKTYLVHRLIWVWHNGDIGSNMVIDHIDNNGFNNKIENLRLVDPVINARNKPMLKSNKSGIHGVCFQTVRTKNGNYVDRYVAGWRDLNGKPRTKCFSVNVYGNELAEFLVTEYRLHQIDMLNLMSAGYTERHGT